MVKTYKPKPMRFATMADPIPEACKKAGCTVKCKGNCYFDCDCVCPTHPRDDEISVSVLKELCGGDFISARSLFKTKAP